MPLLFKQQAHHGYFAQFFLNHTLYFKHFCLFCKDIIPKLRFCFLLQPKDDHLSLCTVPNMPCQFLMVRSKTGSRKTRGPVWYRYRLLSKGKKLNCVVLRRGLQLGDGVGVAVNDPGGDGILQLPLDKPPQVPGSVGQRVGLVGQVIHQGIVEGEMDSLLLQGLGELAQHDPGNSLEILLGESVKVDDLVHPG